MREVAVIYMRESGVTYHRLKVPFERLMRQGFPVRFVMNTEQMMNLRGETTSHIVISRGMGFNSYEDFKRECEKQRVMIIVDQDDWWHLDEHNPAYNIYEKGGHRKMITETIKIADEVWVTNKKVMKEVERVTRKPRIRIVSNAIDFDTTNFNYTPREFDDVRFGYVGGTSHLEDLKTMNYDFKDKHLVLVQNPKYIDLLHPTEVIPNHSVDTYGRMYDYFNVCLAPLKDTKFNRNKSFLKALEAGATRTAFIGSRIHPYTAIIEDGKNGILCGNANEWKQAIEGITLDKIKELSDNLYIDVKRNYSIDVINKERIESLWG